MANFSVNQARQLYVVKEYCDEEVTAKNDAGAIVAKYDEAKSHLYFQYKGADTLMRSDLIGINKVIYGKATSADAMAYKLKTATVVLNPDINDGAPISGQDYVLRIAFKQYVGMSDEDQYFKYGQVHAYPGMTATDFYTAMALSLYENFSKEVEQLLSFTIGGSVVAGTKIVDGKKVPTDEDGNELTADESGILITEVEQDWRLGVKAQVPVYFLVQPTTVLYEGDHVIWGTVTPGEGDELNNGKKIADLEFFCMGERGDIYRGIGYPHNIVTTYLVDPTQAYNILDLHYYYNGGNEAVQKSEKTITFVSTEKDVINSLINKINDATGMEIAQLE